MFREVTLEVRSRNDLLDAAKRNGATMSIADCRPLDKKTMVMLLEVSGSPKAIEGTVLTLQKMAGVKQAYEVEGGEKGSRVFVIVEKPSICQASGGDAVLCLDCPFDSTEVPSKWRFVTKNMGDLGQIMARLGDEGIQARVQDVSPVDDKVSLTKRERGIISVAVEMGYFEFPRRITLEGLSEVVGVKPADLKRIIRSVE